MMYQLTWITPQLAAGYAPMSYAELDSIREQGVTAIVNLCGEFSDLHEIEESSGFEVYFLPVPDECAPDMEVMEEALEWLDEAVYLNKKILIHCRHGHGRTGTFLSAYLLRRGLGLKLAEKTLKGTRANPTNYCQWKLLRQYGKKAGKLTNAQPKIDNRPTVDLSPWLKEYRLLLNEADKRLRTAGVKTECGRQTAVCCHEPLNLPLIESIYLSRAMNRQLSRPLRHAAIERGINLARRTDAIMTEYPGIAGSDLAGLYREAGMTCPLSVDDKCLVFADRPAACRWFAGAGKNVEVRDIDEAIATLSRNVYLSLTGKFPPPGDFCFSVADTVSGKFVQMYFQAMLRFEQRG